MRRNVCLNIAASQWIRAARREAAEWTNEARALGAGMNGPHDGERIHRRILAARSR
jgi:hypothetical protein